MMINHQNHLVHLVDKLIVVVTWAFVASLVASVEDMLQNERHKINHNQTSWFESKN